MFPLAGKDFPKTTEELTTAIHDALADVFTLPSKSAVAAKGGDFPVLKSVTLDLDGASISATDAPPKPVGVGKRKPGPSVEKLAISGHPIRYQKAKLDLDLTAKGVTFDFDRDKKNHPLLVLTDAEDGKVSAKISKADLQAVALEAATLAAKQQGVAIQELSLDLKQSGPRSVAADVRVKAKKMMMSGVIHIAGQLDVDDELNATLSNLTCTGEGVIGGTAAAFLKKKIQPLNGKEFPLMAFSLGDITLRDLKMKVGANVEVSAAFGSK
jgi:hypothetical protein